MAYRSLIVAPETDLLLVDDEVQAVVNSLGSRMLRGHVTASDVVDMAQQQFDILWFATHGDENGVLLSDAPLGASTLTSIARTANASLVVLNTCASLEVALAIHNELLLHVVCTIRRIPDRDAFLTAKQFAFHLSQGMGYYDAYLRAKPGQNRTYLYLMGREGDVYEREPPRDRSASPELARLVALIDGDEKWSQPGLMRTTRQLQDDVSRLYSRVGVLTIAVAGLIVVELIVAILIVIDRIETVRTVGHLVAVLARNFVLHF